MRAACPSRPPCHHLLPPSRTGPSSRAMLTLHGSIPALVTPFTEDARHVDEDAFAALVERQVRGGSHGLVPVGTTGESPTLSEAEHVRVIGLCVEAARGRVPVIAGVGSNNTEAACRLARGAAAAGADALLATTGYYNKPSQAGLIQHYEALRRATDLPVVIYNVPGRTASDVRVETLAALSFMEGIVGVKDATGDLARVARHRVSCKAGFVQLSGEDATAVGFNAMGGRGRISVAANVAPERCASLQDACADGDWDAARDMQGQLIHLIDALFADTNPAPVKYALSRMGLCKEALRLPLVPASEGARRAVDAALEGLGR